MEDNVQDLVKKMVEAEREEMSEMNPPEVDIEDHYYTTVGITLFQMVDQNVRGGARREGTYCVVCLTVCLLQISALSTLGVVNKLKVRKGGREGAKRRELNLCVYVCIRF